MTPFRAPAQSFSEAYEAARLIETLDNYVVADRIDNVAPEGK
ncbi:hypothetical protein [Spirosoma flavus]